MPEVYQALPSAGLSLPQFQHLVDSPSESRFEELGSEHGDGDHGDEHVEQGGDFGDRNPNGPGNDPPDDDGPGDQDDEDPYDDGNQPNLADAIAALARNVGSQRDSSRTRPFRRYRSGKTPDFLSSTSTQFQRSSISIWERPKKS